MANIKSAIKRNKQNEKRRQRNRIYRGRARTFVKYARESFEEGTPDEAKTALMDAISALDKAAAKGVIHKNNASRRKSRLVQQYNKLMAEES